MSLAMREFLVPLNVVPLRVLRYVLLLILCALLPDPSVRAAERKAYRDWSVQTWETEDGLPENSATAMVQTSDGYLWFGTFKGLVRFDGIKFKVFTPANTPGLPHAAIVNLHLDRQNRLWASTYGGLAVREGEQWRTLGKPGEHVRSFTENKNGDLLITMFDGPVFEFRDGTLTRLPQPPGETGEGYLGLLDDSGLWWVVQNRFIGRWVGREWKEALPVNLPAGRVVSGKARDGGAWLFLDKELRKYGQSAAFTTMPLPDITGGIWSLSEDSRGNVWLCTMDQGVYQVDSKGEVHRWTTTNVLSAAGTRFVFEDRENNLWIGTSGGGLARFKERRFQTFSRESGLSEPVVHSVSGARAGGAWIATYGKGLFRLDQNGIRQVPLPEPIENWRYAQSVLEDSAGRVWLGTFNRGLFKLEQEKAERFEEDRTAGNNVTALYEDSRGRIWMSGGKGVAVYESGEFRVFGEKENSPRGGARFQEDSEGVIWASNLNGVFRFESSRFEELKVNGESIPEIDCLKSDRDGAMWLGSLSRGLLRLEKAQERLIVIDENDGFPVKAVHAIERDSQGFLWMTSNRGVVRVEERELHDVAQGKTARVNCQFLDLADGLATIEFASGQQPAAMFDSRGTLWIATSKGVAAAKPAEFRLNTVPPATHIEELKYYADARGKENSQEIIEKIEPPFKAPLTLPAGSRRAEIIYTGLSYSAPEKVRFQIKLQKGKENAQWENAANQRMAVYHDMRPGRYIFSVRAEQSDGVRDEEGASLAFAVLPFFWQTGWFRTSVAGLLLGAGWMASRWWSRVTESEKQSTRRMTLAAEVAHLGTWQWDIAKNRIWMTSACCDLFQFPTKDVITYESFLKRIHPDDRTDVRGAIEHAMSSGACHVTLRLGLPDQSTRWIVASGLVDFDRNRKPLRMLGACVDISDRRNAEEVARELSGRLIHAQEDERRRIARELHDDLNQRLALLSVEMELLGKSTNGHGEERAHRLEQVATHINELSSEVHKLSYRLHPAKLDQLGLVAAARSFCRELTQQSGIKIEFAQRDVPRDLPAEVALCVYRVMQESLQNMIRHSHAATARVQLRCERNILNLEIEDSGTGFDLDDAQRRGGLGLISMKERIRLVHGTFAIQSQKGKGTQITAAIPLAVNAQAAQAKSSY